MPAGRGARAALALLLGIAACSGDSSVHTACLEAVGHLHSSIESYADLLQRGVEQMRDADAVEKLDDVSASYTQLLDDLKAQKPELHPDIHNAHSLLISGVGLQVSAWMSISDGLRYNNPDLIEDAAEMITLSRDVVEQSQLAIPDCSVRSQ